MSRRPRFSPDMATKYQRAFQGSYEGAIQHWKKFAAIHALGVTALYGYEFLAGQNGWLTIRRVERETAKIEAENVQLTKSVFELKQQDRLLATDDFVLEKTVRENLRMARPGEILYLFDETPQNASSTSPVRFQDVTVAKRPKEKTK